MTLRRRFFPSTPVQQAPGQTVQLEVQMRPEVLEPMPEPQLAGDCECNVGGVALLMELNADQGEATSWQSTYTTVVRPRREGWRLVGAYTPITISGEYYPERPRFRAVLAGLTTCNVTWTWTLDVPPFVENQGYVQWWDGVDVVEQDGTLLVTLLEGFVYPPYGTAWWAELRMQASCAGETVGTLVLRPMVSQADSLLPLPE